MGDRVRLASRFAWGPMIAIGWILTGPSAYAQTQGPGSGASGAEGGKKSFLYVTNLGDIEQADSVSPGRVHVSGGLTLTNTDYSRGGFDGVPDDLDELVVGAAVRLSFQLFEEAGYKTTLVLGSANSFWTDEVFPADSEIDAWYESNNFVGLAADLGNEVIAAVTYSIFSSPNDVFGTSQEVAVTAEYGGDILGISPSPQLKIAFPVDDGEGIFTQLKVTPLTFDVDMGSRALALSLPLTLGVGFADYYGSGTRTTGYVQAGLQAAMPLGIPSDYGTWTLKAGFDVIARADDLADSDPALAGDDTLIYVGAISLSLAY